MDDIKRLFLMQVCDSNFPIGNFSHSFGLETYIQQNRVINKNTFSKWLCMYFSGQMVYGDGGGCSLAYCAIKKGNVENFLHIGELLNAASLAKEVREANRKIGTRFLYLVKELLADTALTQYEKEIFENHESLHPALVFALIGAHLGCTRNETVMNYLYGVATSLVQNGVRAIPLGQTDGQKILLSLTKQFDQFAKKIACLTIDDLGATPPGLEMSQMIHERLTVRIFMS